MSEYTGRLTPFCTSRSGSSLNRVSWRVIATAIVCSFLWNPSYRSYANAAALFNVHFPGLNPVTHPDFQGVSPCPRDLWRVSWHMSFPSVSCSVIMRCSFSFRWSFSGLGIGLRKLSVQYSAFVKAFLVDSVQLSPDLFC